MRGTCSRCGKQARVTEYIGTGKLDFLSEWLCDKCAISEEKTKKEEKKK